MTRRRQSSWHAILSVALGLMFTGCASTAIFQANFDADAVGGLPNPNPPGDPVGDTVWSTAGSSTTMFTVVDDAVIGSRSVRFTNVGPTPRTVGYIPVEASRSVESIYARWIGVLGSANASLDVCLCNGHLFPFGGLRFENGNVQVLTSTGYDTIGNYQSNSTHVVVLAFNRAAGTFNVSFLQGSNTTSRHDMPVLNASAPGATRPVLAMSYGEGGSSTAQYTIDEVVISEKEPEL